MKKYIIALIILLVPSLCIASITFTSGKWETTFDCDEQLQSDGAWLTCDDMESALESNFVRRSLVVEGENNWTQSAANNDEYYYIGTAYDVAGTLRTVSRNLIQLTHATVGSLTDAQYDFADNDTLGVSTVYVKSVADPDTEATDYIYMFNNVKSGTAYQVDSYLSTITTAANNPLGTGRGFRGYDGDGLTIDTGNGKIRFATAQKELWVRMYQRHETGYKWGGTYNRPIQDKNLYFYTGVSNNAAIVGYAIAGTGLTDTYAIQSQGSGTVSWPVHTVEHGGWTTVQGGTWPPEEPFGADGNFHCIEVYLKMDTDRTDGRGRILIDGVQVAENLEVDWSGDTDTATAQAGWLFFDYNDNNNKTDNAGVVHYVDTDDIVVYNVEPPNSCDDGAGGTVPCIGLISATAVETATVVGCTLSGASLQ